MAARAQLRNKNFILIIRQSAKSSPCDSVWSTWHDTIDQASLPHHWCTLMAARQQHMSITAAPSGTGLKTTGGAARVAAAAAGGDAEATAAAAEAAGAGGGGQQQGTEQSLEEQGGGGGEYYYETEGGTASELCVEHITRTLRGV